MNTAVKGFNRQVCHFSNSDIDRSNWRIPCSQPISIIKYDQRNIFGDANFSFPQTIENTQYDSIAAGKDCGRGLWKIQQFRHRLLTELFAENVPPFIYTGSKPLGVCDFAVWKPVKRSAPVIV
jgi:hypothetical protein